MPTGASSPRPSAGPDRRLTRCVGASVADRAHADVSVDAGRAHAARWISPVCLSARCRAPAEVDADPLVADPPVSARAPSRCDRRNRPPIVARSRRLDGSALIGRRVGRDGVDRSSVELHRLEVGIGGSAPGCPISRVQPRSTACRAVRQPDEAPSIRPSAGTISDRPSVDCGRPLDSRRPIGKQLTERPAVAASRSRIASAPGRARRVIETAERAPRRTQAIERSPASSGRARSGRRRRRHRASPSASSSDPSPLLPARSVGRPEGHRCRTSRGESRGRRADPWSPCPDSDDHGSPRLASASQVHAGVGSRGVRQPTDGAPERTGEEPPDG